MELTGQRSRLVGIDTFRLVAFIFIVALHVRGGPGLSIAEKLPLEILPRFAVPFFFIVSGYFMKLELESLGTLLTRTIKRLVPVYVIWIAIYLAVHKLLYGYLGAAPLKSLIIDGGPAFHLWFLPSLGVSIVVFAVLHRFLPRAGVISFCIALYTIGLYFVEFHAPYGPQSSHWNFRDGPFFGCIFIAIGFYARRTEWQPRLYIGAFLVVGGIVAMAIERFALIDHGFIQASNAVDYTIGTIPFGAGILAVALQIPSSAGIAIKMAYFGRFTLGFYCIHVIFMWLLKDKLQIGSVAFEGAGIVVFSIATIMLCAQVPAIRRLIS